MLSHATAQQELVARLEVLRESQGIEIGRSQLEALLAISNEAAQRRQRCEQLLLRHAHTVMLGSEGLEGKTQREFIGLYSRQLQSEAGVRGVSPLTQKEQQRLMVLHDVVGVRHVRPSFLMGILPAPYSQHPLLPFLPAVSSALTVSGDS